MNITNLAALQDTITAVQNLLDREQATHLRDLEHIDLNRLSGEDIQDLSPEQLRELQQLQEFDVSSIASLESLSQEDVRVFLDQICLLKNQITFVLNTNTSIYHRVKQIFFSQYKIFHFIMFSGFVISSMQLKQEWNVIQEKNPYEVEKVQVLVRNALITGGLLGAMGGFDAKELFNCLFVKFQTRMERFRAYLS